MAKRVFFSFHYQDVIDFRANVVRNHNALQSNQIAGYFDASIWEDAKKESSLALKRLINKELQNTSVTCVLVGAQTYNRRWVRYEIVKSFEKGNHILAIHINKIKGKDGKIKTLGNNPLNFLLINISEDGKKGTFYEWKNSKWVVYEDLKEVKYPTAVAKEYRGKSYQFSDFYKIYDWKTDNGYDNFSKWVEK